MPTAAGVAILLALPDSRVRLRTQYALWTVVPAALLLVASIIGSIHTTERHFAGQFLWHAVGLLLFVVAVYLVTAREHGEVAQRILLGCALAGAAWSLFSGWSQALWGFASTLQTTYELAEQNGWVLHKHLLDRMTQYRVYAGFTYPNSYAAHMLLLAPVMAVWLFHFGETVEPPHLSRWVCSEPILLLFIGAVILSGSRGAMVGLAAVGFVGGVLWVIRSPRLGAWLRRLMLAGAAVVVLFLATVVVVKLQPSADTADVVREADLERQRMTRVQAVLSLGRGMGSVDARFDYYRAAVQMFAQHPIAGVGMGEFYPWYMRLKNTHDEETRLAHNVFLHFLSQCGVFGGAAALIFLLQPLVIWWLWHRGRLTAVSPLLLNGVVLGCVGWGCHSLFDFNIQVPGTLVTCAILPLLVTRPDADALTDTGSRARGYTVVFALAGILAISQLSRATGERMYQEIYNTAGAASAETFHPRHAAAALLPAFERVDAALRNSPYPYDLLGKIAQRQHDHAVAEIAFKRASERTPHRSAFYALRAESLLELGRVEEAEAAFEKALEWYPNSIKHERLRERFAAVRNAQGRSAP
jgi:hypothetical protein